MSHYRVKLIAKKQIAEDTMAFIFEKPKEFVYKPGQYARFSLLLPDSTASEKKSHFFSLASIPDANELMIATRMRGGFFKQFLSSLLLGNDLEIEGPMGSFTLHEDSSIPAVYLTGGIGITPVRSIIQNASQKHLAHPIYLFYSNECTEAAAFLPELVMLNFENPHFHFVPTMTKMERSVQPWPGERGKISRQMIEKYLGDLTKPIYYISGSATLVKNLTQILLEAGVAEDRIHTEKFSGYQ